MKKPALRRWIVTFVAAIAATSLGCTMKSQETPALTGPSELGVSITLRTQPEILVQDGSSQSLVTITARDSNGAPKRDVSVITGIFVDGVRADFGSVSARNLVTDANGEARLMYTAPALPSGPAVDNGTIVEIGVTPLDRNGTGGFGNSTTRFASIRLIPPGIVVPPDGLQPAFTFTPSSPTDHQNVLFDASTSTAAPNNPIVSFSWNFGDGATGSGRTATHAFNAPGTYVVTLTVTDQYNRSASTSQTIDVAGGTAPTASFLTSPSTPLVGDFVNFNASASVAAPGRTIRSYAWDFGDGTQKTTTTPITTHDFVKAGVYTVTLVVTDDVGRQGVTTASVTVTTDAPTADFTFSQLPPSTAHTMQFNSSGSQAAPGRTIASYSWDFGDGSSSTLASPTHAYGAAASYNVTLTVTDSTGKVGRVTKTVQVQ
ncbi:MAG TPA: PKD domain-containing protein [Vicinamibacterales bacterium]|nr:PKD domain-containing protein [Vicinamibacterales bacterium]